MEKFIVHFRTFFIAQIHRNISQDEITDRHGPDNDINMNRLRTANLAGLIPDSTRQPSLSRALSEWQEQKATAQQYSVGKL